jgi:ubiquinone/menaquinone biosynthesis C-methylase UbiE
MAALFDRLAESYDAVGVEFFKPIAAGLVAQLAPKEGERVVDVGCGRGAVLIPMARAIAPRGTVVGIDLSSRMVELARAEASNEGVEVEVTVGDAMDPDLPPESFDVVASSLVLFFLPDPLQALVAWRSLLVVEGRVGVTTFADYDHRWRDEVDALLGSYAAPGSADARTTGRSGPFGSDDGMERLLRDAGFREVRTATSTVSPRFDDPEHWFRWSLSVGQRRFWDSIPEAEFDEVRATVLAAVDQCRDGAGRLGFDQQVRHTIGVR